MSERSGTLVRLRLSGSARLGRLGISAVPAIVFMIIFFLIPIYFILQMSLKGGSISSYRIIFTASLYYRVMASTAVVSATATIITVSIAYVYALAMTKASGWWLTCLFAFLLIPFWTILLLRTFAWIILLQDNGVINNLLKSIGFIDIPLSLIRNKLGMMVGMVHILLPYAVLSLYSVMSKIDTRLIEAALISGASRSLAFRRIYFPLSVPGVVAALTLVYTLCLGFYITPALLGGPRDMMIGQLIADQVQNSTNFPLASALSIVLLLATVILASFVSLVRGSRWARSI